MIILLKIATIKSCDWTPYQLSLELGHTPEEIELSIERLKTNKLIRHTHRPDPDALKNFLLMDMPELFPASPGQITRGMMTGAKATNFYGVDLPYTSIWVWPLEDGPDIGFEIIPLSPHCCFATLHDRKLRQYMGIVETLRVGKQKARTWAEVSFRQSGLF